MDLINDLELNPFLRSIWVSDKSKEMWESVINECSNLVQKLEILSVKHNHRSCAWRTIKLKSLPDFSNRCNDIGLIVLPIKLVANWGNGFAHKTYEPKKDDPDCNVYCIISKNLDDAIKFRNAHFKSDHVTQGYMLGFPECCTRFFDKYWAQGYFDPIWQIANRLNSNNKIIEINNFHPYSNPLLRYIGIRIGFHIPCSFNCESTIAMSKNRLKLINDNELLKILQALLSMPVEWNCNHGIVIVKTPIFYIVTSSMPTKEKYIVRLMGKYRPSDSEYGSVFPFIKED